MGADINDTWRRIETWLSTNAPHVAALLAPPATPADIATAEATLGRAFPPDFVASASRHNGQLDGFELFGGWELLSLDRIVDHWRMLEDLRQQGVFDTGEQIQATGPVQPIWWTPAWIPALVDTTGDVLSLDVEPPSGGTVGQVVLFRHNGIRRNVVASSFADWLSKVADDLEAGEYELVHAGAALRRKR